MSAKPCTSWRIVAFKHPDQEKSLLYLQDVSAEYMIKKLEEAIEKGANLVSIRGFVQKGGS